MIYLIAILYASLFPINEAAQPDCEGKLKELNYTYEYDKEPAMENRSDPRGTSRYSTRYINMHDSIPIDTKMEIKSIYNCFKVALRTDTTKVLFFTINPLIIGEGYLTNKDGITYSFRSLNINTMIEYHNLKGYRVYFKYIMDKQENNRVKMELLNEGNSKLKAEKVEFWEECKNCPF
jgi:hypothetical protein